MTGTNEQYDCIFSGTAPRASASNTPLVTVNRGQLSSRRMGVGGRSSAALASTCGSATGSASSSSPSSSTVGSGCSAAWALAAASSRLCVLAVRYASAFCDTRGCY